MGAPNAVTTHGAVNNVVFLQDSDVSGNITGCFGSKEQKYVKTLSFHAHHGMVNEVDVTP